MNPVDELDMNIALDPLDWESNSQLSRAYLTAGKLGHAYTFAMMAMNISPSPATRIEAGLVLGAMGHLSLIHI